MDNLCIFTNIITYIHDIMTWVHILRPSGGTQISSIWTLFGTPFGWVFGWLVFLSMPHLGVFGLWCTAVAVYSIPWKASILGTHLGGGPYIYIYARA